MASVGSRSVSVHESSYGETEHDANAALLELDKGLRSTKVGDQCESIVKFPRLFEKFPFPILINSAFLKLSDVFRLGNNFLRLCILKVTQQTEKHLDKILNVEEFMKRILMVIHSNDPLARALTLRTLGSIACIIAETKNVHHTVISCLDSHDSVELEAAIFAATRFAEQSKTFTVSIYTKLSAMIDSLATPIETKLKLLPIFEYMYHDIHTISGVRELCVRVLKSYPAKRFVLTTLHVLSQLASKSRLDIPDQVELLLSYVESDPRSDIKVKALKDLKVLANQGPHMWTKENIQRICQYVKQDENLSIILKTEAVDVLVNLASTIAVSCLINDTGSEVSDICTSYCYHDNVILASKACSLLTHLAVYNNKMKGGDAAVCSEAVTAMTAVTALQALLYTTTSTQSLTKQQSHALRSCLRSVVLLCSEFQDGCQSMVDIMASILTSVAVTGDIAGILCDGLSAIGNKERSSMQSILPGVTAMLQLSIQNNQHDLAIKLSTLVFQATSSRVIGRESQQLILELSQSTNDWVSYRMARQAARYAHHFVASQIFATLSLKVSSEHYLFWLKSLQDICKGEHCLQSVSEDSDSFIQGVTQATFVYHQAISCIRAASRPSHPLTFHCKYMKLRVEMIQACCQLHHGCQALKTCPLPAIASLTSGPHKIAQGQIITQLEKSSTNFKSIVNGYKSLYQSLFDADPQTLLNIQHLVKCCQFISSAIDRVLGVVNTDITSSFGEEVEDYGIILEEINSKLNQATHKVPKVSHESISCLLSACRVLLTRVPFTLPRYFFQSLQVTSITLAISPQARGLNEPVTLQHDSHLTLKVEGVIQNSKQPSVFRKVDKVKISVTSQLQSRSQTLPDAKPAENIPNKMETMTEPHNDYFSCHFLLAFPVTGLHTVSISTSVVDKDGLKWNTGPQSSLLVKSYDELLRIQQHHQHQMHRAQQRATNSTASRS